MAELVNALLRVPLLADVDSSTVTRLAGLTNINYLVERDDERFVVRLPGAGTGEYIDRIAEEVAARSAAKAGVNAEVVFFDATDGLMVTRFVDGAVSAFQLFRMRSRKRLRANISQLSLLFRS